MNSAGGVKRVRRRVKGFLIVAIAVALLVGAGFWWRREQRDDPVRFRTVPVTRGNVVAVINATGTVEPEEVVDVGAQVSGFIKAVGVDANEKPINYGSAVKAGMVLAWIDDTLYAADVETNKAQLQQAEANLRSAVANVEQVRAKLLQAEADWKRAQRLGPSEALAPSAFDQYKANYEVAQANLGVAEAAVGQTRAALAQAQAVLAKAQRNLGYCTITSPVDGVVVDRRVNIGQTVVSSMNAPSLFLIAKNLKRIQVWASVNEADVGRIHPEQPVAFTVDAFPDQVFHGRVGKIRLNATMTQNVVTYTVEVNTDNSDGVLLPYLTANVKFEVGRRQNVLQVPNAALRWTPVPRQIAPEFRHRGASGGAAAGTGHGTLWAEQAPFVRPIPVTGGLTDGVQTEVSGADISEGLPVVVGELSAESASAPAASGGGASPFVPQFRFGRQRPAQGGAGGGAGEAPAGGPGAPGAGAPGGSGQAPGRSRTK